MAGVLGLLRLVRAFRAPELTGLLWEFFKHLLVVAEAMICELGVKVFDVLALRAFHGFAFK